MGVKKQMDTFFASLNEMSGYRGRLINTPMGPFKWNDVMELWENVNNGMVLNNISFLDEFAMMDYSATDGGSDKLNITPVIFTIDFTSGMLSSIISYTSTHPGTIIDQNGLLDYSPNNIVLFGDFPSASRSGWAVPTGSSETLIDDVDGNPNRAVRMTSFQGGSRSINFSNTNFQIYTTSKTLSFWVRGNSSNIGNCFGNAIEVGIQTRATGGYDGPLGTNSIWGWSLNGTCEIYGFTAGITFGRSNNDLISRRNLWRINNLSPTEWTKIVVKNYDNALTGFNVYPGTASGEGATFTFDYCQFNMAAGSYTGYARTTGTAYFAPRFTSGPTGGPILGIWLEPEVKNLLTNSYNISSIGLSASTGWTNSRIGVTLASEVLSPIGITNAYRIFDDPLGTPGAVTHRLISDNISQIAGFSYYTASAWFKASNVAGGLTNAYLQISDGSETMVNRAIFDLQNFTVGSTAQTGAGLTLINRSVGIQQYNNGWARCYLTSFASGHTGNLRIHVGTAIRANENSYIGSGTGTGSIFVWGPQFETGVFPNSFVPNANQTSNIFSFKANEDARIKNLNFNPNINEYTLYSTWRTLSFKFPGAFPPVTTLYNGTDANDNTSQGDNSVARASFSIGFNQGANTLSQTNTSSTALVSPNIIDAPFITVANNLARPYLLTKQGQSFIGNSGSESRMFMSVNGLTGSGSGRTAAAGATMILPNRITFTNTRQSNPDGLPGIILSGITYISYFEDRNTLAQKTI